VTAQVHQFIEDAAKHLAVVPSRPSAYEKALVALTALSGTASEVPTQPAPERVPATSSAHSENEKSILVLLAHKGMKSEDIAKSLSMIPIKVEVLIKRLAQQGLVTYDNAGSNSAYWGYYLTPKGKEYVVDAGFV
jgi:hypothetical protein